MTSVADVTKAVKQQTVAPANEGDFSVALRLYGDYVQVVDFGPPDQTLLAIDEPLPLGQGRGPNPARMLASAVGACLGASLLYCLRRSRLEVSALTSRVEGTMLRNERGRLRIGGLRVTLSPTVPLAERTRLDGCLRTFEDFCTVTQSIREGIDVEVNVEPVLPHNPGPVNGKR